MLIKKADDKSKRITLLEELQRSSSLDFRQRDWLKEQLRNLQRGIQGERDAAHYIDSAFKNSTNNAVIHDLRIVVDGEVAQIDHLIVNRTLTFYLLETKCFAGNVHINDRGEFSVEYPGDREYGVPSPLEQSKRHEVVLSRLLERLEITGRLNSKPRFYHAVLIHPKATITRPDNRQFNTDNVIKADQIATWHERHIDKDVGFGEVLAALANLRSQDTTKDWAEKIARQHRPTNPLDLPDFMKPRQPDPRPEVKPAPPVRPTIAQQPQAAAHQPESVTAVASTKPHSEPSAAPPESLRKKLVCVTCGGKITYAEGKYCWNNEVRFGGFQYCREHQSAFSGR